jgi:hypothetical protein
MQIRCLTRELQIDGTPWWMNCTMNSIVMQIRCLTRELPHEQKLSHVHRDTYTLHVTLYDKTRPRTRRSTRQHSKQHMHDKANDHTNSMVTKNMRRLQNVKSTTWRDTRALAVTNHIRVKTTCSTHCNVDIDVITASEVNLLFIDIALQLLTTLQNDGCTAAL